MIEHNGAVLGAPRRDARCEALALSQGSVESVPVNYAVAYYDGKINKDGGWPIPESMDGFIALSLCDRNLTCGCISNGIYVKCDFAVAQRVHLRCIDREHDVLVSEGDGTTVDLHSLDESYTDVALTTPKETLDEFCRRNHITRLVLWIADMPNDQKRANPIPAAVEFEPGYRVSRYYSHPNIFDLRCELGEILGHSVNLFGPNTPQERLAH